ncbi:uncharacterized protein LOC117651995 [Thrips palmi]|uniref:Uncharacterized protein LOC117651995 n=1 Tax=Thrips palmi TaxID=161013 RepID=A0A6P9A3S7_THRPL|nr:uncharacterized protein LOC117651995 [Thrips palmi]
MQGARAAAPSDSDSDVTNLATHIANTYFPNGLVLLAATTCDALLAASFLLISLNTQLRWTFEVVCGKPYHRWPLLSHQPSAYILLAPVQVKEKEIAEQVEVLRGLSNWNARAKFLVLLLRHAEDDDEEAGALHDVHDVLRELWRHLVVEATVARKERDSVSVWTHSPILRPGQGPWREAEWRNGRLRYLQGHLQGQLEPPPRLYQPQVVAGRLANFTLRAVTFDWPPFTIADKCRNKLASGIEVRLLRSAGDALGFRLHEVLAPAAQAWPGLMKRVNEGSADVAYAGIIPYAERFLLYDASGAYLQDRTRWFATTPRALTVWESVYHVFRPQVWLLLLVSYATTVVLEVSFARLSGLGPDLAQYETWSLVVLDSWRALVDTSVGVLPASTRVRLLFTAWVLGSMHLNQAFRSLLTSSLSSAQYERVPRTLDDLVASGLPYAASDMTMTRLYGAEADPSPSVRALLLGGERCANPAVCITQMRRKHPDGHALAISQNYVAFAGRRAGLVPMDDTVITYFNVVLFRRGHPLFDLFNRNMLRAVQAGLVEYWEGEARRMYHVEPDKQADKQGAARTADGQRRGQRTRQLRLHNIDFVFAALFAGCAFATACFGLECLTPLCRRKAARPADPALEQYHAFRA